jgi:hypothetical protein
VLGVETKQAAATPTPAAVTNVEDAAANLPPQTKSFLALLASPFSTLEAILTALLTLVATAYGMAVLMHGKKTHRKLALGGAILLIVISTAILLGAMINGPVLVATDSQMASVIAAFP